MAEETPRRKKGNADKHKEDVKVSVRTDTFSVEREPFPVVAVGASAGGLEAFEQFFKNLPSPAQAAFVVISHLDQKHASIMAELISRFTELSVREATDGVEVEPGHVYVIPPNRDLSIFHGRLQLRAIFVSGYTGDVIIDKGVRSEKVDFLQKPLSAKTLLTKVREVLDRQRALAENDGPYPEMTIRP